MAHKISILAFGIWVAAPAAMAADVTATATGLRSTAGQLKAGLFRDAKAFPGEYAAAYALQVTAAAEGGTLTFRNVPPGEYAIAVFHDADADGKLDTNFIGIPKEGVGVSRNPKGRMGPPRFRDAVFSVPAAGDAPIRFVIMLTYL